MNINELIGNNKCPLINAFFFSNGDMLVLNNDNSYIGVLCKSSIESYFYYNSEDSVSSFDILNKYETDKFIISIGEGSYGGDGVIQLDDKSGKLIWFLFLDNSNPFIEVVLIKDYIEVISTKNVKFKIPILHPERIVIE